MLKQQARLFKNIAVSLDITALFVAFVSAYYLRTLEVALPRVWHYLWALLIIIPVWLFLLTRLSLYESLRTLTFGQILSKILQVQIYGGMITASLLFLAQPLDFRRRFFSYFLIVSFLLITGEKVGIKLLLGAMRRRGYNIRNLLIVGTGRKGLDFAQVVERHADWGLKVVGFITCLEERPQGDDFKYEILGGLDELCTVCKSRSVDDVVFCLPHRSEGVIETHLKDMSDMGLNVRMVLDSFIADGSRRELSLFHNTIPMITFYSRPFDAGQLFLKRCLDLVGAVIGLLVTALFTPFIALAIKLESPGPLLFGQERVGMNGRIFTCWKFRSMYVDADARKQELMHLNEMQGAIFKIKNDPRVTRVGAFLRKTSLDELPQFWNVLMGEMSLVGTRPPTPAEVAEYENWHRRRISMKPGITGLWQVSGRSQINEFDEIVKLDLRYIDQWSVWLDIKLIFKTIVVVCFGRGAC